MMCGFRWDGLGAEVVGGGAGAFAEEEVTVDEVGEDGAGAVGTEASELGELRSAQFAVGGEVGVEDGREFGVGQGGGGAVALLSADDVGSLELTDKGGVGDEVYAGDFNAGRTDLVGGGDGAAFQMGREGADAVDVDAMTATHGADEGFLQALGGTEHGGTVALGFNIGHQVVQMDGALTDETGKKGALFEGLLAGTAY